MSTSNNNVVLHLRKQPSPHSSFTNFKLWIKGAILRNQKEAQPIITAHAQHSIERTIRRLPSTSKRVPPKRSSPNVKRRKSRTQPSPRRRSRLFNLNNNDNDNDNENKNKNPIIIDNRNDVNNCLNDDGWVDEEILNKDELIIPNINSALSCESSTVISNSPSTSDQDLQSLCDTFYDSKDDFLENTRIIKGSVEHFAYVRTLRKLRGKDKQRATILQFLLLNNILKNLSSSQLSDEIREALVYYKKRVYELNRIKRNSINNFDQSPYSTLNDSTSTLCPSSMVNKRLSAILSEIHTISPITMKYRASYASSKVVMVFDEESNQLVVKELPMARRRRRLSDLSNVLSRSTSSTTTSTNSSQSSLVTLTDDVEQHRFSSLTTKESDSYLSSIIVIRNDDDDDDDVDEEDHVPLFVLKEQFKYSGRSYTYLKNNISSVEENGPSRVTLAV